MTLPTSALSIMQPWAWLICAGHKSIENRDWTTKRRGPILIHAGKKMDKIASNALANGLHPVSGKPAPELSKAYHAAILAGEVRHGGIVGTATITDCIVSSADPWFVGDFGFVLKDARPLPFTPFKGALNFFNVPKDSIPQ